MNDNQNGFVKRPTSRVLAEPGGKSSMGFLFGGSSAANRMSSEPTAPAATMKTPDEKNGIEAKTAASSATPAASPKPAQESAIEAAARIKKKNESQHFSLMGGGGGVSSANNEKETTSSNAFASAATTNSYNVLTDRSTSRVLRPPGGHSSIKLW
mmetsp:Transcript_20058/g.34518  ORF Transcript_20058/g.34518 Transcript_20058/m.34518 type:complete len:155 (+) Transcript_20058:152-616(+)